VQRVHPQRVGHCAAGGHQRLRHDLSAENATARAGRVMGAELVQFDRFEIENREQFGECGIHGGGIIGVMSDWVLAGGRPYNALIDDREAQYFFENASLRYGADTI